MSTGKFKRPGQIVKKDEREPISARVKVTTKETLEKAANKEGCSLASLIAGVLDDYAEWLKKNPKG